MAPKGVTMKKPAQWVESLEYGPMTKPAAAPVHAPSIYGGAEVTDLPDGTLDIRQVSRAQRRVFHLNRHSIDPKTLERYDFANSKECQVPGTTNDISSIINSCVARASDWTAGPTIKERSGKKVLTQTREDEDTQRAQGYFEKAFIGLVYHGNEGLFKTARAAGECENYSETGRWYTTGHSVKRSQKRTRELHGTILMDAASEKTFNRAMLERMAEIGDEVGSEKWFRTAVKDSSKAEQKRIQTAAHASQDGMQMLQ
ncbi:unnamed protein product, partial [Prorocentrum cordatum]